MNIPSDSNEKHRTKFYTCGNLYHIISFQFNSMIFHENSATLACIYMCAVCPSVKNSFSCVLDKLTCKFPRTYFQRLRKIASFVPCKGKVKSRRLKFLNFKGKWIKSPNDSISDKVLCTHSTCVNVGEKFFRFLKCISPGKKLGNNH